MKISLSLSLILICVIVFPIIHAIPKDAEMTESKNANLTELNDSEGSGKKVKDASADVGNAEEKTGQNIFKHFLLFILFITCQVQHSQDIVDSGKSKD